MVGLTFLQLFLLINLALHMLGKPVFQQLQKLRAKSLRGEQVLTSKGKRVIEFRLKEHLSLGLRDKSRRAEEFTPPIEGKGHIDVPQNLTA